MVLVVMVVLRVLVVVMVVVLVVLLHVRVRRNTEAEVGLVFSPLLCLQAKE